LSLLKQALGFKKTQMKIIMIRPNIGMLQLKKGKKRPFDDRAGMEPLQLGVLAGLTPSDVEVKLFDDRIEPIDFSESADLVAISVEIFTARRAYEIADEYRKRGVKVILGGIHVSNMPEEAAQHADSILISDAEAVWSQVVDDLKHNTLQKQYVGKIGAPHPGIPINRQIYEGKKYFPISLMQYARGCPYKCSFCASGNYYGGAIEQRSVEDVVNDIKNQKRKFIFFVDENIVGTPEKSKELFKALIPLKIKWVGQASTDMTDDLELMSLMQQSGCIGLVVGFESFSPNGLEAYNKNHNIVTSYDEKIKIIRKHKIHIWAAFLLGHDGETEETLQMTLNFAKKYKFSFGAFNILMPYPNTPIYDKLEKENRLMFDGKWWLSEDYVFNHAAFIPKNMSHEKLTAWCFRMRKEYNSVPFLLRRLFAWHNISNLRSFGVLFRAVWLFRKEALKKQKMKLGFSFSK